MPTTLILTAIAVALTAIALAYAEGSRRHRKRLELRLRGIDGRVGRLVASTAPPTFGIYPAGATFSSTADLCDVPPPGWTCTRTPGHDGPCAAIPIEPAGTHRRELITADAGRVVVVQLDADTTHTITRLDDDGNIVVAQAPEHDGPWTDAVVIQPPRNEQLGSTQVQIPDGPLAVDQDESSLDEISICGATSGPGGEALPCIREPHPSENHVDATGREWSGLDAAERDTFIDPPLEQDDTVQAPWCASTTCPKEHRIDTACDDERATAMRTKARQEFEAGIERAAQALTPADEQLEHHPGAQGRVPARFMRAALDTVAGEVVSATVQHLDDQLRVVAEQPATIADDGTITAKPTCTWECPSPCVEHADKDAINGRHPDGTRRCRTEGCNASPETGKAWCPACRGVTLEPADVDEDTQPEPEPEPEAPIVTRSIDEVRQAQTSGHLDDKRVAAQCDQCDWQTDPAPVMQLDAAIDEHLAECPGRAASRVTASRTPTATEVGHDAIAEAAPATAKKASAAITKRASSTFDAAPPHDSSKRRPGDDPIAPAKAALVPGLSTPAPKTVPAAGAPPIPEGWATIKDAAAAIGRSDITMHGWVSRGKLEHREVPNPGRGKATVRIVRVADAQAIADAAPARTKA